MEPILKTGNAHSAKSSSAATAACESPINRGVPIGSVAPVQIKINVSSKPENKMGLGFDKTFLKERMGYGNPEQL